LQYRGNRDDQNLAILIIIDCSLSFVHAASFQSDGYRKADNENSITDPAFDESNFGVPYFLTPEALLLRGNRGLTRLVRYKLKKWLEGLPQEPHTPGGKPVSGNMEPEFEKEVEWVSDTCIYQ
jgi:hypothetical protein